MAAMASSSKNHLGPPPYSAYYDDDDNDNDVSVIKYKEALLGEHEPMLLDGRGGHDHDDHDDHDDHNGSAKPDAPTTLAERVVAFWRMTPRQKRALRHALLVYLVVFVYLGILFVAVDQNQRHNLPAPAPATVPATQFSEARAFIYLQGLVGIALAAGNGTDDYGNHRIVGRIAMQPSANTTAQYLLSQLQQLQDKYGATSLEFELQVASGDLGQSEV